MDTEKHKEEKNIFDVDSSLEAQTPASQHILVYKESSESNLPVLVIFFMIITAIGIVFSLLNFLQTLDLKVYDVGAGLLLTVISAIPNIFFVFGVIGFGIYSLFSLYKRKSNAPTVAIVYSALLIYSNFIQIFVALYFGESEIDSILTSYVSQMLGIVLFILWVIYFNKSKRLENIFPHKRRALDDRVMSFAISIVVASILSFFI